MSVDPCEVCRLAARDGMIAGQDCENCKKAVFLLPGNELAWELIMKLGPGLFEHAVVNNGKYIWPAEVGVQAGAVEYIFNTCGIPLDQREDLHDKIMAYAAVIIGQAMKERD